MTKISINFQFIESSADCSLISSPIIPYYKEEAIFESVNSLLSPQIQFRLPHLLGFPIQRKKFANRKQILGDITRGDGKMKLKFELKRRPE